MPLNERFMLKRVEEAKAVLWGTSRYYLLCTGKFKVQQDDAAMEARLVDTLP